MLLEVYVARSLLDNVSNLLCFTNIVLELIITVGNCPQTVLFYQIDVRLGLGFGDRCLQPLV
jgi:hypothetical protein